jgi:hypothetical protein
MKKIMMLLAISMLSLSLSARADYGATLMTKSLTCSGQRVLPDGKTSKINVEMQGSISMQNFNTLSYSSTIQYSTDGQSPVNVPSQQASTFIGAQVVNSIAFYSGNGLSMDLMVNGSGAEGANAYGDDIKANKSIDQFVNTGDVSKPIYFNGTITLKGTDKFDAQCKAVLFPYCSGQFDGGLCQKVALANQKN